MPPAVPKHPGGVAGTLLGGADVAKDKRPAAGRKKGKTKGLRAADFFEEWLLSISHSVKPSTLRRYGEYVRLHATPAFGDVRLTRLSPSDLERLYVAKLEDGLAPRSVLHLHMALHRALRHAQRR